jgi:hypothetical protein
MAGSRCCWGVIISGDSRHIYGAIFLSRYVGKILLIKKSHFESFDSSSYFHLRQVAHVVHLYLDTLVHPSSSVTSVLSVLRSSVTSVLSVLRFSLKKEWVIKGHQVVVVILGLCSQIPGVVPVHGLFWDNRSSSSSFRCSTSWSRSLLATWSRSGTPRVLLKL